MIEARDRAEERLGVRMPHRPEQLVRARALDDLAGVHHHDPVGPGRDHAEVVRDQDHGHLQVPAQRVEQVEDLRLDRHVQRGRRLVRDEQLRRAGQRHRDHHALAQAAGELVRVGGEPLGGTRHADELEHLAGLDQRLLARHVAVQPDGLGDLLPHRPRRVQRRQRILEDHRDVVAAHLLHLALGERREVLAEQLDRAARHVADARQQLHDRQPGRRLPATRLAHEAHALALGDAEGDPVDRFDVRRAQVELGLEVLDLEEHVAVGAAVGRIHDVSSLFVLISDRSPYAGTDRSRPSRSDLPPTRRSVTAGRESARPSRAY